MYGFHKMSFNLEYSSVHLSDTYYKLCLDNLSVLLVQTQHVTDRQLYFSIRYL